MKKILIIGAGQMQLPIIRKCNNLGYCTIVTDGSNNAPGLKEAKIPLVIDTLNCENTLKAAREYGIDGVITTSDFPVNTVAYVCEHLNLRGISRKGAKISTNKYLQRQILHENHIKVPQFVHTNNFFSLKDSLRSFNYPLVIKPVDSSASRGVLKVHRKEDLENAFSESSQQSKSGQVIIEEFVFGNEYSVECLTQNGKTNIVAITEKITVKSNSYFVEESHVIPADLSPVQTNEIEEYVQKIIPLFNVDNSASHIEIKVTDKSPVLIELGARLGGDYITSDLVPLATGIDILALAIFIALDQPIQIGEKNKDFSGVQFIHKHNYKRALRASEVKNFAVKMEINPYNEAPLQNSLDRLGFIIFQEESRKQLQRKMSLKYNQI